MQAMSFLVGTPESTAAAMSFCIHCLSSHPEAEAALLRVCSLLPHAIPANHMRRGSDYTSTSSADIAT